MRTMDPMPNPPWHQTPPAPGSDDGAMLRYKRSLTLTRMAREVEALKNRPHYAKKVEYNRYCIEHWQEYLSGTIDPPTGRKMRRGPPPLPADERFVPWNVTLPPSLSQRLIQEQAPDETKSALLTRLLEQALAE
jgi:hypothetical protein